MSPSIPPAGDAPYCGHCGEPVVGAGHGDCERRAPLEPPRYCARCRRRMVVQVTPRGWTARCSEHGVITSGAPAVASEESSAG